MSTQVESSNEIAQSGSRGASVAYLAVGLGIGAVVTILLAPKSGEETRKWLAVKCLDALDAANEKVRKSRVQVKEIIDRGQQQVTEAVAAGRGAIGKANAETKQRGAPIH
jgi:gas vesicle protein